MAARKPVFSFRGTAALGLDRFADTAYIVFVLETK